MLCLLARIALEVEGIKPKHCKLNFSSGTVSLIVEDGLCNINSEEIKGTRDLNHGEWLNAYLHLQAQRSNKHYHDAEFAHF